MLNCCVPVGIYLLKVNNRNTRTRFEICSKLTIKTPERRHQHRSGIFIVNFERISHLVLVFLLLTLNMQLPGGEIYCEHVHKCLLGVIILFEIFCMSIDVEIKLPIFQNIRLPNHFLKFQKKDMKKLPELNSILVNKETQGLEY